MTLATVAASLLCALTLAFLARRVSPRATLSAGAIGGCVGFTAFSAARRLNPTSPQAELRDVYPLLFLAVAVLGLMCLASGWLAGTLFWTIRRQRKGLSWALAVPFGTFLLPFVLTVQIAQSSFQLYAACPILLGLGGLFFADRFGFRGPFPGTSSGKGGGTFDK